MNKRCYFVAYQLRTTHITTQDKARFPRTLYTGKLFVR